MKIKRLDKRGVSPVIATVLILLITIVAATLISVFVIPFVRDNLSQGGECFDVLGDLSFDGTPYNCRATQTTEDRTGFSVRVDNDNIAGFKASFLEDGSADTYEIKNGVALSNIRMLSGNFDNALVVPDKGGVRTYVANGTFERIDLFPMLKTGRLCDMSDTIKIEVCTDQDIIDALFSN